MNGPEHPADRPGPEGEPTRYAPTDFLSRHAGAEGHGDHRERDAAAITAELNRRSEFVQELERHARTHRTRLPDPDGATAPPTTPP